MTDEPWIRFVVPPARHGVRLDVFLAEAADMSRRRARSLIADGTVSRNQRPIRVQSRPLDVADVIQIPGDEIPSGASAWTPPPIDIVFEDRWLAAVDKPFGMLTQPSETSRGSEFALDENLLLFLALRDGRKPFLRTIHRLDRVTSGLVLFARSQKALPKLDRSWRSGAVERFYLAVVHGRPDTDRGIVDAPIARDRNHAWRFQVDGRGKPARTEYSVLTSRPDQSVLLCRLDTGRTHQVRVHLAHLGHPVVGDRLYGPSRTEVPRAMLHAWALALPHPRDGRDLRIISPIPEAVRSAIDADIPDEPWSES